MNIVGKACSLLALQIEVDNLTLGAWRPSVVVIHHCSAPSLAQRPNGFQPQHMLNLKSYYEGLGWSAGPHLFVDEDEAWIFSPLNARGVHAVSFNAIGWGIEMLGDFDSEDPWSGRGLQVLTMTAHAAAILLKKIGRDETAIRFHRDDPRTTKTCPGTKVDKARFVEMVRKCL